MESRKKEKKSKETLQKWLIDTYCVFLLSIFAKPTFNFLHYHEISGILTFHFPWQSKKVLSSRLQFQTLCKIFFRVILETFKHIKNRWSKTSEIYDELYVQQATARIFFGEELRLRTVFENHRKSFIQHCERSELRLHFEWTKVN